MIHVSAALAAALLAQVPAARPATAAAAPPAAAPAAPSAEAVMERDLLDLCATSLGGAEARLGELSSYARGRTGEAAVRRVILERTEPLARSLHGCAEALRTLVRTQEARQPGSTTQPRPGFPIGLAGHLQDLDRQLEWARHARQALQGAAEHHDQKVGQLLEILSTVARHEQAAQVALSRDVL